MRSTVPKLVARLASPSKTKRESALAALSDQPVEHVLGPVADLLVTDGSPRTQASCLELLDRFGAVVQLESIRTDGWFERLGEQIANFRDICALMGDRFLAYSIILGIQIRSLTLDPKFAANTTVEFSIGDAEIQTLALNEFRVRVVQALLVDGRPPAEASPPLTQDDAAAILGGRMLLLPPLFRISLEQLVLGSAGEVPPRLIVGYISPEGFNFLPLKDFYDLIKGKVRRDLAGTAEEPFRLDLFAVERARKAFAQGNVDGVIAALEAWPGLLSILQRTPVVQQLDDGQRALIGEGICLLGEAFEQRNREHWSEELYRLGLQFIREGRVAARLFFRLGRLLVENERGGEAIGLLRRALSLGAEGKDVLPVLGRAFFFQGKIVTAMALFETAAAEGALDPEMEAHRDRAQNLIEESGIAWCVPRTPLKEKEA